jgi:multiple sugar transport system substrate-binding protein
VASGLALALAGCVSADDGEVISLWALGSEGEWVQQMLPGFEARNPGLRVRVQQIPWSAAHEKLLTAYAGDALPDVMQLGNTWIPEFVALRALAPLDARIDASASVDRDDFFPGILATNVVGGVTWGVPWYVDTRVLFYRSDLLARAGFDTPPRSWAAWLEAMRRVRELDGADRRAILLPLDAWEPLAILALQRGAGLLRDGDGHGDFANPAFREAFDWYLELFRLGLAPQGGEARAGNLYRDFAAGRFAMLITGPWNLGEFARRLPPELATAWTTAPMPAPGEDGVGVSIAGGASLVVSRSSLRKDAAWKLVEYLSLPDRQIELYRLAGDLPARRSAWQQAGLTDEPRVQAFWTQLGTLATTPRIPEWERIASRLAHWSEEAVRGNVSPEEALAALDREVDAILEKRRWLMARGLAATGSP